MLSRGLVVFVAVIVNCNGADIKWEAQVKTSDVWGAGTNAGVFIQIIGQDEKTGNIQLDYHKSNFERNMLDTIVFTTTDVGPPKKLRVWHDRKGSITPNWHLGWIKLKAVDGEYTRTYMFNCDCWLAMHDVDHATERIIPVSNIQWEARVVNSDINDAGTKAGVFIQIIGEEGKTKDIQLGEDGNNFETDSTDTFVFHATDVGTPTKLRVWHDDAGDSPNWHLTRIELKAKTEDYPGTYVFNCDCWIGSDQLKHGKERIIPVSRMNWEARVTTSNMANADTRAPVGITIFGVTDQSRKIRLNNPGYDFLKGATDLYTLQTVEVGQPTMIVIQIDGDDEWHLDKIILENLNGGQTYMFYCDCWLGGPGKTIKSVNAVKVV